MTAWVGDFGGKPARSPTPTSGARQSTPPDIGSAGRKLTLMKGLYRIDPQVDVGRRENVLVPWRDAEKVTEWEEVLEDRTHWFQPKMGFSVPPATNIAIR